MDITDTERDLILAGLFELTITYVEDDENASRPTLWFGSSVAILPPRSSG